MSEYKPLEMYVICLDEEDCVRTSASNFENYDDNELPLVPFLQQ